MGGVSAAAAATLTAATCPSHTIDAILGLRNPLKGAASPPHLPSLNNNTSSTANMNAPSPTSSNGSAGGGGRGCGGGGGIGVGGGCGGREDGGDTDDSSTATPSGGFLKCSLKSSQLHLFIHASSVLHPQISGLLLSGKKIAVILEHFGHEMERKTKEIYIRLIRGRGKMMCMSERISSSTKTIKLIHKPEYSSLLSLPPSILYFSLGGLCVLLCEDWRPLTAPRNNTRLNIYPTFRSFPDIYSLCDSMEYATDYIIIIFRG